MQNIRRISQGIFLLIFLFLFIQTESTGTDELGYPVRIFLECDPLIALATLLSSHSLAKGFALSLIVVVMTIILGRVFCGWICPLGTFHNIIGSLKKPHRGTIHKTWYRIKYYILFFVLAASLFTAQVAGTVDPLSLLIRSFSISVYPAVNYVTRAFFDTFYALNLPVLTGISELFYSVLKKTVLTFQQPFFYQGTLVGSVFLLILGLNLIERRFWCKYLCPLGALLGILSWYSILKRSISEGCTSCGVCENICSGSAIIDEKGSWRNSECLYCMDCDDLCPHGAISFGFSTKKEAAPIILGRRNLVMSTVAGIAAVPFLRIVPLSRSRVFNPRLIRPPGSLDEREFLTRCIRCGECMKVCITNGLQPALIDAGLEGIWTPMLIPKIGYCEYRCTLCGQVCPTDAITQLTLREKEKTKIGTAVIDRGRCLPHAYATPCIVCEEVCPTPRKAIWLEPVKIKDREGNDIILKQPYVDLSRCVGCGTCEAHCPVKSRPAIYVISSGESRSQDNRILL